MESGCGGRRRDRRRSKADYRRKRDCIRRRDGAGRCVWAVESSRQRSKCLDGVGLDTGCGFVVLDSEFQTGERFLLQIKKARALVARSFRRSSLPDPAFPVHMPRSVARLIGGSPTSVARCSLRRGPPCRVERCDKQGKCVRRHQGAKRPGFCNTSMSSLVACPVATHRCSELLPADMSVSCFDSSCTHTGPGTISRIICTHLFHR